MVLEAIEDANGGEKAVVAKKWVPVGIKAFKETANSYKAIGLDARHASLTIGSERPKQTLETARALIRELLAKWIEELKQTPTGPP